MPGCDLTRSLDALEQQEFAGDPAIREALPPDHAFTVGAAPFDDDQRLGPALNWSLREVGGEHGLLGVLDDVDVLDLRIATREGPRAERMHLDSEVARRRVLVERLGEVARHGGEVLDDAGPRRLAELRDLLIRERHAVAQLEVHDGALLVTLELEQAELERLDVARVRVVAVEAVLDVDRVQIGAHVGDRRVLPAEEQE
ncbi:hypothetical protein ACFPRL_21145 [Pseudoclavibacter helvolus]